MFKFSWLTYRPKVLSALGILLFLTLASCLWKSKPKVSPGGQVIANGAEITVEADKDSVSFVPSEIWTLPGEKLKIRIVNDLGGQPINFLVLRQGEDPIVVAHLVQQQSQKNKEMWIPDEDYVIASAHKVEPQKNSRLSFSLPDKEGQTYYFVSTYPGQAESLKGKIVVKSKKELDLAEQSREVSPIN